MRMSRGVTATIGSVVLAMGAAQAAPVAAAPRASADGTGWHWVTEGWQPAPQGDETLPAARYCRTFDLKLSAVTQDVRSKVLSRWDNGKPKDTFYAGPLTTRAENLTTGKAKNYNMGGDAWETDYPTGMLHTYRMIGPVGMGMPVGASAGLSPSFYVMNGYHVVQFNTDDSRRTLTVSVGTETDICAAVR